MDPKLFAIALSLVLSLPIFAALALWPRVRAWCEDSLFPWVEKNMPRLAPVVRNAFAVFDNAVTAVRRLAWHQLREHLLHQVLTLQRRSPSVWVRLVTSWLLTVLPNGQHAPVQIVAEGVCSWDELPAEARSQWLRQGQSSHEINVTELRDKELAVA